MSYQMTKIKVPNDSRKFWGAKNFELEVVNAFDISNAECCQCAAIRLAASLGWHQARGALTSQA